MNKKTTTEKQSLATTAQNGNENTLKAERRSPFLFALYCVLCGERIQLISLISSPSHSISLLFSRAPLFPLHPSSLALFQMTLLTPVFLTFSPDPITQLTPTYITHLFIIPFLAHNPLPFSLLISFPLSRALSSLFILYHYSTSNYRIYSIF